MPTFAPHIKMTALGTLGDNEQEKFAYGLNLARNNAPDDFSWFDAQPGSAPSDELMDALTELAQDVVAFHARPGSLIHPLAVLRAVKFAAIGENGKYVGEAIEINVADTPGGSAMPQAFKNAVVPQSSLAVSLGTGSRLASARGRFYPPMSVVELQGDLHVALSFAEDLRASAAQLVSDLNNAPGLDLLNDGDWRVVIASGTKATNTEVTEVRVGRLVDTIRSRRRQIPENYTAPLQVS